MAPRIPSRPGGNPKPTGDGGLLILLGEKLFNRIVMEPLSYLLAWVLGDEPDDWDTIDELRDNLIPALIRLPLRILVNLIGGIPIIGDAVEDALADWLLDTNESASTALDTTVDLQTQVTQIQEVFNVTSGRSLSQGVDPTGEGTFDYQCLGRAAVIGTSGAQSTGTAHTHGAGTYKTTTPTIPATASVLPWGIIRCGFSSVKKQITWMAYKTGTVVNFYLDVYRMEDDGTFNLVHSTADLNLDLVLNLAWMQATIPQMNTEMDDVLAVQFRVVGSGTVFLAGLDLPAPFALPGFRPMQMGAIRTVNNAPATITDLDMQAIYSGLTPYLQIGSDVGQVGTLRSFYDAFNRAALGPNWILRKLADATDNLKIESNRVVNPSLQLIETWADGQWIQPLATDHVAVEADFTGLNTTSVCALLLCGNGGMTEWVMLMIANDEIKFYTCPTRDISDWVMRASTSVSPNSASAHWKFEYDEPNNQYVATRNGVFWGSWSDLSFVVEHGPGRRYVGMAIDHYSFNSGGQIDNWMAYDVEEA